MFNKFNTSKFKKFGNNDEGQSGGFQSGGFQKKSKFKKTFGKLGSKFKKGGKSRFYDDKKPMMGNKSFSYGK